MYVVMIFASDNKLEEKPKFFKWRVDARAYALTKVQSAEYAEIFDADGLGNPGNEMLFKLILNRKPIERISRSDLEAPKARSASLT